MQGGKWINPSRLRMVGAEKLNDKQMTAFRLQQQAIKEQLLMAESTAGKPIAKN
jgi:hypothetical protein